MCGIVAYLSFDKLKVSSEILHRMNYSQNSRGPDSSGHVLLKNGHIGLAHTRLSIIDLSKNADQPMASEDGDHWIVFNGEIYNFKEIRKSIENEGHQFFSFSDTEVLLRAFICWGEKALEKIEGIFAVVYLNLKDNYLLAARDRIGVKPLCYYKKSSFVCFSSTVTPLTFLPGFSADIDPVSRFEMLTAKYVVSPRSIYKNVRKLMPGTFLKIDFNGNYKEEEYWSPEKYFMGFHDRIKSEGQWMAELEDAINNSVERQLVADVPVGVFLSGGIDSSVVAATAIKYNSSIKSFTVGFAVEKYNEAPVARRIAEYLGIEHHEIYVTPEQVIDTLKDIVNVYDEPFGDASSVPTYLISRFARKHVKVVLSGDGGDEQFFGYSRYHILGILYPFLRHRPEFLRKGLLRFMKRSPRSLMGRLVTGFLAFPDDANLYSHYMLENFSYIANSVINGDCTNFFETGLSKRNLSGFEMVSDSSKSFLEGMMMADMLNYLPDDCLTKVDRASMANSLEVRVPLLDENILRVGLRMPVSMKWRNGKGKYLMRKLLKNTLPTEIVNMPKKGFGVPLNKWLFGEMKDFTMDILSRANLIKADLDPDGVHKIIDHHKSGFYDHQYSLWPICCYVNWYLNCCR